MITTPIELPFDQLLKEEVLRKELLGADLDIIHDLSLKRNVLYITKSVFFGVNGRYYSAMLQPASSVLDYVGDETYYLYSITGKTIRGAFVNDSCLNKRRDTTIDILLK